MSTSQNSTTKSDKANKAATATLKASLASRLSSIKKIEINLNYLIILVSLYLVASANFGFFTQVLSIYPFSTNMGFLISITGLLFALMWLLIQLFCYRPIAKVVLIAMVLIAAVCSYFTDAYGTIFDNNMLINSLQTDPAEAIGLM